MLPDSTTPEHEFDRNPFPVWLRWVRTSPSLLVESERKLLNRLRSNIQTSFVSIFENTCFIRTLLAKNHEAPKDNNQQPIPMVLMHGFASGLGLWCKNMDALAKYRHVYAFDLLGFGRSSRPDFPSDPEESEAKFVNSFEEWRKVMQLEKFILVGHSLGGYLSYSYAIAHPHRIEHLILVDPWGFKEAPFDEETVMKNRKHSWIFRTIRGLLRPANPLSILRGIGPLGRSAISYFRQDLIRAFDQQYLNTAEHFEVPSRELEEAALQGHTGPSDFTVASEPAVNEADSLAVSQSSTEESMKDSTKALDPQELDGAVALDYVYHINVQRPSGEVGFKSLCTHIGWAKRPMLKRVTELDPKVPITFIYGSRSWMDMSSGTQTQHLRPNSYVDVKIIEGAGHQVYAQAADEFNAYVNYVARRVDNGDPFDSEPKTMGSAELPRRKHTSADDVPRRRQTNSRANNYFFPQYPDEPPTLEPDAASSDSKNVQITNSESSQ